MIIVPKPTPIPASWMYNNNTLPYNPQFSSGRIARARNTPSLSLASPPLSPSKPTAHPQFPFPQTQSHSPPSTPTKRQVNKRKNRKPKRYSEGEFDMAMDLSDMSYSSSSGSETPSPPMTPMTPYSPNAHTQAQVYGYQPQIQYGYGTSLPSSYPIHTRLSIPTKPPSAPPLSITPPRPANSNNTFPRVRPSIHQRSPSLPTFFTQSASPGDRYANSTFQNSPPPKGLPKPKFLDSPSSAGVVSKGVLIEDEDVFM